MTSKGTILKDVLPPRSSAYYQNRIDNLASWDSKNHEFGSCLVNHKKKLLYVQIPKCASTWMKSFLDQGSDRLDWMYDNVVKFDHSKYQLIILLRDPEDRWYSNMPGNTLPIDDNLLNLLKQSFSNFSQWLNDEHSTPQTDFLTGLNLSRAVFFKCDSSLAYTMKNFLSEHKLKHYLAPEYKNSHVNTEEYQEFKLIWQQLLAEEKYFNIFKKTYAKDYELINQVKYYENN